MTAPGPVRGAGSPRNGRRRLLRLAALLVCAGSFLALDAAAVRAGFYDWENGRCSGPFLEQMELKPIFQGMAQELCAGSCAEGNQEGQPADGKARLGAANRTVLVTDFVDLQSLQANQPGILMGELMRGSLNSSCGYNIIQAEFAKYFRMTEKGLVVLSRDVNDLKMDKYYQSECIVGTYAFLNNKLLIFAKRINTANGQISRMAIREIDFDCNRGRLSYTVY